MAAGERQTRIGRVVSDKMQKTVVVAVTVGKRHPLYGKRLRRTKRYKAHDEASQCKLGDVVQIMETRPLAKDKRWWVVGVLSREGEVRAIPVAEEEGVTAVLTSREEEEQAEAPAQEMVEADLPVAEGEEE